MKKKTVRSHQQLVMNSRINTPLEDYLSALIKEFSCNADPKNARGQKAYMKDQFEFLGIKAPIRQHIQKPFLAKPHLPPKRELDSIIHQLWNQPYREYQYFAQELALKYVKDLEKRDLALLEYMIIHFSWWDTVDFIAAKLVGAYLKTFPEERKTCVERWLSSEDLWLKRTAILFQLKYKIETDTELLSHIIRSLTCTREFFINKAIGWALREYGKTNPDWVTQFAEQTQLSPLSRKEALRRIIQ
ncbi:MAG: DNA alkylation repair protein [Bacteroidales bacterium]|nr:DNA alkylation repair protein [Bacteroidales bacterium]